MTWPNIFVDLHWRWPLANDVFIPEAQQKISLRSVMQLRHRDDSLKGKHVLILHPLSIDDVFDSRKARNLAVDGLHLRLEVGAAKADHDGARIGGWGDCGWV